MATKIRRNSLMITIPLVGAAVAYVALVFVPGRKAIAELDEQIKTKQEFINRGLTTASAITAAQQELDKTQAYTKVWRGRTARERELSVVFGKITALAKSAGVTTTRFNPQPPVTMKSISRFPLEIVCTGSYGEIHEFLRGLETLPTRTWVEHVRLENPPESRKNMRCEVGVAIFADNSENSDYAKRSD